MVGEIDGLRALEMRVAGDDHVRVPRPERHERPLHCAQRGGEGIGFVAQIEPQIERDLVVPAARSVELRPGGPDPPRQLGLDIHVDVFQLRLEGKLPGLDLRPDFLQARHNLRALLRRQQPGLFQSRRVRDGTRDVMPPEPPVKADGLAVLLQKRGGFLLEAAFPHVRNLGFRI